MTSGPGWLLDQRSRRGGWPVRHSFATALRPPERAGLFSPGGSFRVELGTRHAAQPYATGFGGLRGLI